VIIGEIYIYIFSFFKNSFFISARKKNSEWLLGYSGHPLFFW